VLVAVLAVLLASQVVPLSVAAPSSTPTQAVGLALTIIPPKLPADGGTYGAVVVSLVDGNGLPSAAFSNLTVFLTSSQTNIASVPNSVTIPVGSEYVVVPAVTTPTPGSTTITASSHGLSSVQALLTTATPSGFPAKLEVFVSPSNLLRRADKGTVRVELVDGAGSPSKAITSVTALLISSNASIISLSPNPLTLTIAPGQFYASGTFSAMENSGEAFITATSTGYASGGAVVTVETPCSTSCSSSELLLNLVPGTLPTDGSTYSALEVGLATTSGQPAVSSSDTIVQLSSSNPDIVSVPTFVTIPAGNISVLVPLTTSTLQGYSSITASSSSLLTGNANVTTVIPAPSKLQAYVAPPSTFVSGSVNSPILVVQLQDNNGNPARARVLTNITVTSSNSSIVSGPLHLSIPKGEDYVLKLLTVSGSGVSTLTASSQGLSSSQVGLQLAKSPLVYQLSASVPGTTPYGAGTMWTNGTARVTLTVSFLGAPAQNLTIHWTATGGSVSPVNTTTGSSETTSTVFTPKTSGLANITASASSPLTGPISKSYLLTVITPPAKAPETFQQRIEDYWWLIVIAVVIVVALLLYVLRMRRKRQRAEIEAGFEVV
jgi:hypothetical protein